MQNPGTAGVQVTECSKAFFQLLSFSLNMSAVGKLHVQEFPTVLLFSWITSLIFFFFWRIVWWSWSCKYSTPGFLRQVLVTGLIYHSKSKCCQKASSRNESNHKRGQALLTKQDAGFLRAAKGGLNHHKVFIIFM